jgi:hypothetical protein
MASKKLPDMTAQMRKMHWNKASKKFERYAWPGGYPIFYYDNENSSICYACASIPANTKIVAASINWEDAHLFCIDCNKRIESAYAED